MHLRDKGLDADCVFEVEGKRLYVGAYPLWKDCSAMSYHDARQFIADAGVPNWLPVAEDLPNVVPMRDGRLDVVQRGLANMACYRALQDLDGGDLLITCVAGVNRSAFIAGMVMAVHKSFSAKEIIRQIRERRLCVGLALRNPDFQLALEQVNRGVQWRTGAKNFLPTGW